MLAARAGVATGLDGGMEPAPSDRLVRLGLYFWPMRSSVREIYFVELTFQCSFAPSPEGPAWIL